jgi:hypothetical protein
MFIVEFEDGTRDYFFIDHTTLGIISSSRGGWEEGRNELSCGNAANSAPDDQRGAQDLENLKNLISWPFQVTRTSMKRALPRPT